MLWPYFSSVTVASFFKCRQLTKLFECHLSPIGSLFSLERNTPRPCIPAETFIS
jgi:hypothetical protein